MEQQRFDHLTRLLARGSSRRTVLSGIAGVFSGAFAAKVGRAAARTRADNGTLCSSPRDCASGLCVDSVCCDGACIGTCEACDVAGSVGICSPVEGAPVGNRGPCPGDSICGGTCDGVTTSHCAGYMGEETVCGEGTCRGDYQIDPVCSGNGRCVETAHHCGAFHCSADASGCLTSCDGDGDCVDTAHCAGGVCLGDLDLGAVCEAAGQCRSGYCVEGVCCDAACDGGCQACGAGGVCAGFCSERETCVSGVCTEATCLATNEDCQTTDQCCDVPGMAVYCSNNACIATQPRCCHSSQGLCCAAGEACVLGLCVSIPNVT